MIVMLKLLWVLLACVGCANGHIFFEFPPARGCFYSGPIGGDGPWRQEPCDRPAVTPTVVAEQGSTLCLKLHEFVPHPGYFSIWLHNEPVNPGDAEPGWTPLVENVDQTTELGQTGYQGFLVTLPTNVTCEHCTIQVRQWAEDFDWYYYACTDVKIVGIGETTSGLEGNQTQCAFEEGPNRIRISILVQIVSGTFALVVVLLCVGLCCRIYTNARRSLPTTVSSGSSQDSSSPEESNLALFKQEAKSQRKYKLACFSILVLTVLIIIGLTLTFVGLNQCW